MKKLLLALLLFVPSLVHATDYTADGACLGAWLMNETSGTSVATACGSNTGTAGAGVTVNQTGQFGKAYSFDGTASGDANSSRITFGTQTYISTAFSIGGWVKVAVAQTDAPFIGRFDFGGSYHHNYYLLQSGSATYKAGMYSNGAYNEITGGTIDTSWHHVVFTWNAVDHKQRLYVDGALVTTGSDLGAQTLTNSGDLGLSWDKSSLKVLNGMEDEMFMMSRDLSLSEVQDIFNFGLVGAGGGGGGSVSTNINSFIN